MTLAPAHPLTLRHAATSVWLDTVVVLAIALPWLNPVAWGPAPEMVQRLLSASCAALVLACWGAWQHPSPRRMANTIAAGWLLAALLSAILGLLQYFAVDTSALSGWISPSQAGQAYANLRQRNQFASLTTLGLLALLYLGVSHAQNHLWLRRAAMLLALALLALGNAASSSRTGVLQWVGVAAMAWVWARHGQRSALRWSLLALAFYLAAVLLLPLLPLLWQGQAGVGGANALERFNEHVGCGSRSILWANVAALIADKPWWGWGWGELKFAHFIHPYAGSRFCEILDNAHNLPLHLAVTLGLPLALLLCGAALAVVLRARPWRETQPARQMAWAAVAVLGLHSLLEYPLWYGPFQMALALCLGLLWRTQSHAAPPSTMHRPIAAISLLLCTSVLALVAYTGWDYWRVGQLYLLPEDRALAYREDTMNKVRSSWLFHNEVAFAYVSTTTPTPENAVQLYATALQVLHFSPEPRVLATLLASAGLLGDHSPLVQHLRSRWRAAYGTADDAAQD